MAKRTCKIEDCEEPVCARGCCRRHYYNWRRNGDPLAFKRILPRHGLVFEERFWSKVEEGPIPDYAPHLGRCWVWTAALNKHGYGKFAMGGRGGQVRGAHIVAYELMVVSVPDRLELDHLCRVRACVNPFHLEPVTSAENMRRAMAAKTHCDNGHEFTEANTRWYRGGRRCRACDRDRAAAKRAAAALSAAA